jgi:hypothetical protein
VRRGGSGSGGGTQTNASAHGRAGASQLGVTVGWQGEHTPPSWWEEEEPPPPTSGGSSTGTAARRRHGESKRLVVESPWSQFTGECQRF